MIDYLTDGSGNFLIGIDGSRLTTNGDPASTPVTVTTVIHDNGKRHVKMIGY